MIRTAQFTISSTDVLRSPQTTLPEYAFIGRSNVGKSSLINALTRQPKLAKTSQKPGKTLLINHFTVNAGAPDAWALVDLPGYGFAQAGKTQRETLRKMIERYCLLREQLCSLFVLVDARLPPASNRPRLHELARREQRAVCYRLHQSRQTRQGASGGEHRCLPAATSRVLGGTPTHIRHLCRETHRLRRTHRLHRTNQS